LLEELIFIIWKDVSMDDQWMMKAIELAKKGQGYVNPNPKVGAVIVKNGKVIGEGYHKIFGQAHAEMNAINSVKGTCKGAVIYVTLEPCFHYGKTPPCVDAIIREKFKRVVIGMKDPNPNVAGKSIQKLKEKGISVTVGVLESECRKLNPGFLKLVNEKKPYIVMKTAMTLDGKIATVSGESRWITGGESRKKVHELRHELQGIMVGINTVLRDNPMLTARREKESCQPVRIVVDSCGKIPLDSNIVQSATEYNTIVITTERIKTEKLHLLTDFGVTVEQVKTVEGRVDINDMIMRLGELSINSILQEGGGTLNDSMLRSGNVDEVICFISPKIFGGKLAKTPVEGTGVSGIEEAYQLEKISFELVGEDLCVKGMVKNNCLLD
jgi:diaminohydroxyphosphoribosylaminopyrimidine deaminase/5-amino-6-(5-phosphoribosylamino)uracil reductase